MSDVLIGTCSWTDKALIDSEAFYPAKSMSAEDRLRFYSANFPIVEVDSSYYALPSFTNSKLWVERTPSDFTFDIKAFRLFTGHWTEPKAFPRDLSHELPPLEGRKRGHYYRDLPENLRDSLWIRFESALVPLAEAGKLGLVLFQFPDYVRPTTRNMDHILECQEKLRGFPLAIEFRYHAWMDDSTKAETVNFLRSNDLTNVCVDEPQGFKSSAPPIAEATSDIGYVRFHGRNSGTWERKGISASERFDWYYKPEELQEWVDKIDSLKGLASKVHLLMNTNAQDQGPRNARLLAQILQIPLPTA